MTLSYQASIGSRLGRMNLRNLLYIVLELRRKAANGYFGPPGGGGYSIYLWVGRCGAASHTLTY